MITLALLTATITQQSALTIMYIVVVFFIGLGILAALAFRPKGQTRGKKQMNDHAMFWREEEERARREYERQERERREEQRLRDRRENDRYWQRQRARRLS